MGYVSAWTIEEWPLRDQPDGLLAEIHAALAPLDAEAAPEDPRQPLAEKIAETRHLPEPEDGSVLVARDMTGQIAGVSTCWWEDLTGWEHILSVGVQVLPGSRRRGLGRLLLDRSVAIAERRGLRVVMGRTRQNVPAGAAFCASFGASQGMIARENRLDLRGVDRALIDRWIADGDRTPGYRLVFVAGITPPEMVAEATSVANVMNTAPRENLDITDSCLTQEQFRQYEQAAVAAGTEHWAYYAVHESTGRFVGMTDISIQPGSSDRVWVGDTAVEPAHRRRGLGRWLKAAITRRILDELPEVRWVITHNAGSNEAMLAINHELGFRPAAEVTTWQLPAVRLREQLVLSAERI